MNASAGAPPSGPSPHYHSRRPATQKARWTRERSTRAGMVQNCTTGFHQLDGTRAIQVDQQRLAIAAGLESAEEALLPLRSVKAGPSTVLLGYRNELPTSVEITLKAKIHVRKSKNFSARFETILGLRQCHRWVPFRVRYGTVMVADSVGL